MAHAVRRPVGDRDGAAASALGKEIAANDSGTIAPTQGLLAVVLAAVLAVALALPLFATVEARISTLEARMAAEERP